MLYMVCRKPLLPEHKQILRLARNGSALRPAFLRGYSPLTRDAAMQTVRVRGEVRPRGNEPAPVLRILSSAVAKKGEEAFLRRT